MRKNIAILGALFVAFLLAKPGSSAPLSNPMPSTTPSTALSDQAASPDSQGDASFKPHWENELTGGSTNQQGGQAALNFGYIGTYELSEGGDFISGEISGTRQKVEGVFSKTGTLTLSGGLGLSAFTPSLSLGYGTGDSALRQFNGSLGVGFQVSDPFSLNLSLGGSAGNHQGDSTAFLQSIFANNPLILAKINAAAPVTAQIDTAEADGSLGMNYVLSDWWTLSLTFQYAYDETYQIQGIKDPSVKAPVNQADQTVTTTLGLDFILFKGFDLDLEPQVGQEYQPAGTVYSHQTGGLVQNGTATTQNFAGGTVTVNYKFE
jgi:hypothetical protein